MAGGPEEVELLGRLTAASEAITRAVREAGIDVEVAAAACAALAGEYTALVAAAQGLALAPLLREATATLRRRGTEVHDALRQGGGRPH
jgi:hypothetical protein